MGRVFAILLLLIAAMSGQSQAQDINAHPPAVAKLKRYEVIPVFGVGITRFKKLPDRMRKVEQYSYPHKVYTLPDNTGGTTIRMGITAGYWLNLRTRLGYDLAYEGGGGARGHLWDKIKFPSDDFVGYDYWGWNSTIHVTRNFSSRADQSGPYLRGGIRIHRSVLESGDDAYEYFNSQNQLQLRGVAMVLGAGYRFYVDQDPVLAGFFDFELEGSPLSSSNPKQELKVGLRFGLIF